LSSASEITQALETREPVARPMAFLDASQPGACRQVGGIPLVARTLFYLGRLGIKRSIVLLSAPEAPVSLERWTGDLELEYAMAGVDIPAAILSLVDRESDLLYVDAAHLIDARILEALSHAPRTTLVYLDSRDRENPVVRAGLLERADLRLWAKQGDAGLARRAAALLPGDLEPYSPEIRGPLPPYFMEVRSQDEARRATQVLIRSQQKQVMDLPAQYLHPPLANALTRFLCKTPVTPNMVTLFGAAVAALVAWLFWHGYFVAGALLTFAVDILDGVDGKLARTTLRFSRLGRHEDLIDYLYENSWYVALGFGLVPLHSGDLSLWLAALLILSDTADNIFYTLAGRWHGKSIDLFSRFDRAFRRIAGRRNIYGAMFIVGFLLGYSLPTFAAAAAWAAITAAVHGVRLIQYGRGKRRSVRNAGVTG
jgi:phosphatidylglycerophosphate synthase